MIHKIIVIIIFNILLISNISAKEINYLNDSVSSLNFFDCISSFDNIWTSSFNIIEKNDFVFPYYEFDLQDLKIGEGCLFAISKEIPEKWSKNAVLSPMEYCFSKEKKTIKYYQNCAARNLFKNQRDSLIINFDIYVFFIDKKFLDGPFYESSEYGSVAYYRQKPNSKVTLYFYQNKSWKLISVFDLGEETPKSYGMTYLKSIVKTKYQKNNPK